jgi:hypothetical protein
MLNHSLHKPPKLRGLTLQNQKSLVTQPCRKLTYAPEVSKFSFFSPSSSDTTAAKLNHHP